MAYGLRYFSSFRNIDDELIEIEISELDFTGTAYEMTMRADPATIQITEIKRFDSIMSTGCKLNILNTIEDGNFQYKWMFMRSPRDFILKIIKSKQPIFEGYLIASLYEEEFIDPPYDLTLSASCGLSRLDQFDSSLLALNSGNNTLISIITKILALTGFDYNIQINSELFELNHTKTSTRTLFDQTYLDRLALIDDRGEYLNCKKLLENILQPFNCRIYQSGSELKSSWTTNAHNIDNTVVEIYGDFTAEDDFAIDTLTRLTTSSGTYDRSVTNVTTTGTGVDKKVIITLDQSSPGQSIRIVAYVENLTWKIERIVDLYDVTDDLINYVEYDTNAAYLSSGTSNRNANDMYNDNSNIENFKLKFAPGFKRMSIEQEFLTFTNLFDMCNMSTGTEQPDGNVLAPSIFEWQWHAAMDPLAIAGDSITCSFFPVNPTVNTNLNQSLGRTTGVRSRTRMIYNGTDEVNLIIRSDVLINRATAALKIPYTVPFTIYIETDDPNDSPFPSQPYGYIMQDYSDGSFSFVWRDNMSTSRAEYVIALDEDTVNPNTGEGIFEVSIPLSTLGLITTKGDVSYRVLVKWMPMNYGDNKDDDNLNGATLAGRYKFTNLSMNLNFNETQNNVIEADMNTTFTDVKKLKLQYGDVPNVNYKNGFWIDDANLTSAWGERTQATIDYVSLLDKMALDAFQNYSQARHYLSGTLYRSLLTGLSEIFEDKYLQQTIDITTGNMPFYIAGYSYNLYFNTYNIKLNEFIKNDGVELL